MLEALNQYLVIVVVLICGIIGYVLKNIITTDKINKFIPLIMAVLGVVLTVWYNGFTFTPEVLLSGLASGLAATGTYELIHNFTKSLGG